MRRIRLPYMKKPKQSFRHGDVFTILLPDGQFLFERVMFDVGPAFVRQSVLATTEAALGF
jgi:hypothetical protein